jgi:hypothetical protein
VLATSMLVWGGLGVRKWLTPRWLDMIPLSGRFSVRASVAARRLTTPTASYLRGGARIWFGWSVIVSEAVGCVAWEVWTIEPPGIVLCMSK